MIKKVIQRIKVLKVVLTLSLLLLPSCVPGGELSYTAPYEVKIEAGEDLIGTGIRYVGMKDSGAEVLIEGQRAFKRKGDSLDWEGSPVEGVKLNLSLRVLWYTEKKLYLIGRAKVVVRDPQPQSGAIPVEAPLRFSNAPVSYLVKKGSYIPGTQIKYLGKTEKGAELSGVEGYPYRKALDSILWEGKIREKVYLRLNLRVGIISEHSLGVGGLATIWITP
jgi:hypothetical protein